MPETISAPDSDPERQAPANVQSFGNLSPVADGAQFARTEKAFAELGRTVLKFGQALRDDVAVASRPMAKRLRILGGNALQRFRDLDFSTAKLRAGAERSVAVLSRVVRKAPKAEISSANGNSRRRKLLLQSVAAAGAASLMFFVGLFAWALGDVPWEEIADGTLKPVVALETYDGKPLLRQGPIQGPYATREDFPRHLIDAVLTAEDRRFYDHLGIDLRGIFRAVYRNVEAGEVVQGGSTITQQLIKILYLEQDRTWKRKIQEAVIAFWLERKLGKDEVLTRYLNNIYLGTGATGVPAAARIYFDKEVRELTLGESAMLTGIIRAPSQLNPLTNPEGARRQAELVLDAMLKGGSITAEQAKAATNRVCGSPLDETDGKVRQLVRRLGNAGGA